METTTQTVSGVVDQDTQKSETPAKQILVPTVLSTTHTVQYAQLAKHTNMDDAKISHHALHFLLMLTGFMVMGHRNHDVIGHVEVATKK